MSPPTFVNRARELALLEERYASGQAELCVIYGRRRVGKTELLRRFCEGKPHIFFIADLGTEASALADFTRQVSRAIFGRPEAIGAFSTWDVALEFVAAQSATRRLVVVIDEFTYLGQVNSAIPSIFQRLWDAQLRPTQVMLILCSSYMGLMEKQALTYRAPLYGRRTAQWHVQPFTFPDACRFFPAYTPEEQVRAYSVLGGIPAYLTQFSSRQSVMHNIGHRLLSSGSYLLEEPRLLLIQELSEPGRYFSILEAIANKRTRTYEIAQTVGLPASSLAYYLGILREIGIVERLTVVSEPHAELSKRSSYRISDNFFRFWFRYVYPSRSLLGRGDLTPLRRQIETTLDEFISLPFEAICRDHIWRIQREDRLGFTPEAVGSWWEPDNDQEIDVVAIAPGHALLGECKWSKHLVGSDVLDDLIQKAAAFRQDANVKKINVTRLSYALFSRSGFTPELRSRAAAEDVFLFDLTDLAFHP